MLVFQLTANCVEVSGDDHVPRGGEDTGDGVEERLPSFAFVASRSIEEDIGAGLVQLHIYS